MSYKLYSYLLYCNVLYIVYSSTEERHLAEYLELKQINQSINQSPCVLIKIIFIKLKSRLSVRPHSFDVQRFPRQPLYALKRFRCHKKHSSSGFTKIAARSF